MRKLLSAILVSILIPISILAERVPDELFGITLGTEVSHSVVLLDGTSKIKGVKKLVGLEASVGLMMGDITSGLIIYFQPEKEYELFDYKKLPNSRGIIRGNTTTFSFHIFPVIPQEITDETQTIWMIDSVAWQDIAPSASSANYWAMRMCKMYSTIIEEEKSVNASVTREVDWTERGCVFSDSDEDYELRIDPLSELEIFSLSVKREEQISRDQKARKWIQKYLAEKTKPWNK